MDIANENRQQQIFFGTLKKTSWDEIKKDIQAVNPLFYEAAEEALNLYKGTLYIASYPYGAPIIKEGVAYLPGRKELIVPITSVDVDPKIKADLSYSAMPVMMLLNKTAEIYVNYKTNIMPTRLFKAGELFGLFELFDKYIKAPITTLESYDNVSAGAHTLFMLPKISNIKGYTRLNKHYKLNLTPPNTLFDESKIFSAIVNRESPKEWQLKVLLFPQDLANKILTEKKYALLCKFLLQTAWQESHYIRNRLKHGILWKDFADSINNRNLKPKPRLFEVAKHLIDISSGDLPGFRPTELSNEAAPVKLIQQIFTTIYGLPHYYPTIMQPYHFDAALNKPVYYGLGIPTMLEAAIKTKELRSIMTDLRDLRRLLLTLQNAIDREVTFNHTTIQQTRFTFYHEEIDSYGEVLLAKKIPEEDDGFTACFTKEKDLQCCTRNSFMRGCIKISKE